MNNISELGEFFASLMGDVTILVLVVLALLFARALFFSHQEKEPRR